MRGQNPRRIRLDEQDYLAEGDYDAIMPLLRRFKELTFHGSSTPTGLRGQYYRMCRELPEYKEFFYPITDHPDWKEENRETYMLEAKTMDRFIHEFLAEFGDPKAGVFKSYFLDKALLPGYHHKDARPNPSKRYVMGVDWNGMGTGTRIYIVEYDTMTRKRRCVDRAVVDDPQATTSKSIAEITRLNKKWMCDHVYVDAGFGFAQDELLRNAGVVGKQEGDLQTFKLKNIKVIDFGGTLEFNKLVPNREAGEKKIKGEEDDEIKRRTKPFMVEGAVMAFEQELVELSSDDDKLLDAQMRGYRVKTWSSHGFPASYETDAESGDHDLDAFMLAMLGIEIEYGLFQTKEAVRRLAQIVHVAGWGLSTVVPALSAASLPSVSPPEASQQDVAKRQGVQSRTPPPTPQSQGRVLHNGRGAALVGFGKNGPQLSSGGGRVPSRTGGLGRGRTGPSGNFGMSPFHNIGQGIRFNR
jgi:hypothetical protein